jgi:anti-sigma factor (TIGR02949 family)
MNCDEYVDQFLSADADGELTESERQQVEEHLRGCAQCRAKLDEELALKALIRRQMGTAKTPADVRLRIRAALGEAAERRMRRAGVWASTRTSLGMGGASRRPVFPALRRSGAAVEKASREAAGFAPSARRWLAIQLKRAQYLAPVGFVVILLAVSTLWVRVNSRNVSGRPFPGYQRSMPAFDFAIDRLDELSQEFDPNVPAEAFSPGNGAYFAWVENSDPLRHVSVELPDISASYEKMRMPAEFCDFALAGYELVGGRIDHMPDGSPVTYTLYRNQTKSILSIGLKQRISAPQDGYWFSSHAFYSYRGYGICLTIYPVGHFASIIIARMPMVELLRDIAVSDMAF